jgi:MarR family transcriptional regulator, organic hydroperoxide resistance regulator
VSPVTQPRHREGTVLPVPWGAHGGPVSHAIFRLARLHKLTAGQLLRRVGLHPNQELVMMRLWDAGPQKQSDLAEVMESDSATITRTVQRLERAGFVRRTPSTTDRRVTIVEPTAASHSLRREVEQVWNDLEARTLGDLDDDDRAEVLRVLGRLESNLAGPSEPPPPYA